MRMNLDGSGITTITATDANRLNVSTVSGLGKIVYESNETGNSEIFIANLDGTGAVNISNNAADDFEPVVSSDGSTVAFLSNRTGVTRLYVMSSTGTGLTEITNMAGMEGLGRALNANGSKVVFTAAPSAVPQIYIANSNGTGLTNLSSDLNFFDLTPCFNVAGDKVLFSRDGDLYTMNLNGTSKSFVYSAAGDIESPSYTSDGSKIVFMTLVNFGWDLIVINANGSSPVNITNTATDEFKTSGYIGQ